MPFYIFINSIKVINFWNLCENILGFTRKATTVNPEFTDGISRFSYRVFLPLLRDSRENMNFSPVSLYYALAQVSEGAGGNTRAQMLALMGIGSQTPDGSQSPEPAQALHTAQPPAGLTASCGRLYRQIFRNNEKTKLKLVNSMWLKEGAPLNDSFKRTSENEYCVCFPGGLWKSGAAGHYQTVDWLADGSGYFHGRGNRFR